MSVPGCGLEPTGRARRESVSRPPGRAGRQKIPRAQPDHADAAQRWLRSTDITIEANGSCDVLPHHGPDRLPDIAYAYPAGTGLPDPATFRPVLRQPPERDLNRPQGGLWCSPVSARHPNGAPAATAWTVWCNAPERIVRPFLHESNAPYDTAVTVNPLPEVRVYRIDTQGDLNRLVEAYPVPDWTLGRPIAPNWEALVADGTDAVFVSAEGLAANENRHPMTEPSLYGWDCPSVLWLSPAYQLGTRGDVNPEAR